MRQTDPSRQRLKQRFTITFTLDATAPEAAPVVHVSMARPVSTADGVVDFTVHTVSEPVDPATVSTADLDVSRRRRRGHGRRPEDGRRRPTPSKPAGKPSTTPTRAARCQCRDRGQVQTSQTWPATWAASASSMVDDVPVHDDISGQADVDNVAPSASIEFYAPSPDGPMVDRRVIEGRRDGPVPGQLQ